MSAPKDSPFMQNADAYMKENPKLKPTDVQAFNINRAANYKTTIAICAIYGAFALFLLLIILFSPTGSGMLTEELRTFSFTFIIGIVIVIMLIVIQVVYQKPYPGTSLPFDGNMCPDYWKLVETSDDELTNVTDAADRSLMQYKCVAPDITTVRKLDDEITFVDPTGTSNDKGRVRLDSSLDAGENRYKFFNPTDGPAKHIGKTISGNHYNGKGQVDCSKTFPNYMMTKSLNDKTNNPGQQTNLYACAYSQACGVPWSSMCPNGSA